MQTCNPESISTMDEPIAGPSRSPRTYLSSKVLQPMPRLKKTISVIEEEESLDP